MKYLITLLILLNAHTLYAIEIDLGLGYTFTEKPPNTLWYQEEFKHSIDSNSPNYQIGLRFNPWNNIYVTTGYKYLGKFSIEADHIAGGDNDAAYHAWRKGADRPPLSHLKGSGKAHGVYLKAEYHFEHIFFTGGVWGHKTEWEVSAPNSYILYCCGPLKGQVDPNPRDYYHKGADNISYSYIYGVGVKFGRVSILAEIWDTKDGSGIYPIYTGNAHVFTVLYTFI